MSTCLFCKIINREIPASIIYEDDAVIGFHDIAPQAPTHMLFIPKKHVATINDLQQEDLELPGRLIMAAKQTAASMSFAENGYRLVMNCNEHGGQTVYHVHLHMLAGRHLHWPPG